MRAAEIDQQFEHGRAGLLVEIAGGLVGEQNRRAVHERAGDGHALLLAAAQRRRAIVQPRAKPDLLQEIDGALAALARRVVSVAKKAGSSTLSSAVSDGIRLKP